MSEQDTNTKQEPKKPTADTFFDVLVRKQVRRQNEKYPLYQPGEAGLYDPSTDRVF
jgi:hypothetical protein